jgi:hypothetical protein
MALVVAERERKRLCEEVGSMEQFQHLLREADLVDSPTLVE